MLKWISVIVNQITALWKDVHKAFTGSRVVTASVFIVSSPVRIVWTSY